MKTCEHREAIAKPAAPTAKGCEDCLRIGGQWVFLRACLTCGHVGCCNNSPNKHATAHFHGTGHPVIKSFEPDETWEWCFVHDVMLEPG